MYRTAFFLLLFSVLLTLSACTSVGSKNGAPGPVSAAVGDTMPDIGAITFHSTMNPPGAVRLAHGEYRAPAAPGSASETAVTLTDQRAFGTLAGRPAAAVVVATAPGGSGTFLELALLAREAGGWVNTDTVALGDRPDVHAVAIDAGGVAVDMTVHGPDDPMCCPTLRITRRFSAQGGRLVALADEPRPAPPLVGTLWQWVRTQYSDDSQAVPANPEDYTLRFLDDGRLEVAADCNRKGGTYALAGKQLVLEITRSTRAACAPGSLEERFARDLAGVAGHFFRGTDLYLDIKFDTGTMMFSPRDR